MNNLPEGNKDTERMDLQEIGDFLKREREAQGLTQKELAEIAGISLSNLQYVEYGTAAHASVQRVAAALGYEVRGEFFIRKKDDPK